MAIQNVTWTPSGLTCRITLSWDDTQSDPQHTVVSVQGSTAPYPAPVVGSPIEGSAFFTAWSAAQPTSSPSVLSTPGTIFSFDNFSAGGGVTNMVLLPANLVTGAYRLIGFFRKTQAATTSSTLGPLQISYAASGGAIITQTLAFINSAGALVTTNAVNNIGATGLMSLIPYTFYAQSGTAITATLTYASSGATPMQFEAHFRLETI